MKKTTGAAIGYNVRVANNNLPVTICDYHDEKKEKREIRPNL